MAQNNLLLFPLNVEGQKKPSCKAISSIIHDIMETKNLTLSLLFLFLKVLHGKILLKC